MITELNIKNYKSIDKLNLELGRINVFVGENGAGKSNILEIIAIAGAAVSHKLDNEFLTSRGIRVTKPEYMRSAFETNSSQTPISVSLKNSAGGFANLMLSNDNLPYSKWTADISLGGMNLGFKTLTSTISKFKEATKSGEIESEEDSFSDLKKFLDILKSSLEGLDLEKSKKVDGSLHIPLTFEGKSELARRLANATMAESGFSHEFSDFIIYSPENSALRTFEKEGQIEPLGVNGEGLLKLLSVYASSGDPTDNTLVRIKKSLKLLDWFSDFQTTESIQDRRLIIKDRYISPAILDFDHKSTNEGFFFLLFYFSLFTSKLTPNFFAVDNIDASLNPKLCQKLISELSKLAKENNKQAILTTHNPAVLDGLNLDDEEQRLFVISRTRSGATKVKRVRKPAPLPGHDPQKLSTLFLDGMIGGIPKGF